MTYHWKSLEIHWKPLIFISRNFTRFQKKCHWISNAMEFAQKIGKIYLILDSGDTYLIWDRASVNRIQEMGVGRWNAEFILRARAKSRPRGKTQRSKSGGRRCVAAPPPQCYCGSGQYGTCWSPGKDSFLPYRVPQQILEGVALNKCRTSRKNWVGFTREPLGGATAGLVAPRRRDILSTIIISRKWLGAKERVDKWALKRDEIMKSARGGRRNAYRKRFPSF